MGPHKGIGRKETKEIFLEKVALGKGKHLNQVACRREAGEQLILEKSDGRCRGVGCVLMNSQDLTEP